MDDKVKNDRSLNAEQQMGVWDPTGPKQPRGSGLHGWLPCSPPFIQHPVPEMAGDPCIAGLGGTEHRGRRGCHNVGDVVSETSREMKANPALISPNKGLSVGPARRGRWVSPDLSH